MVNVYCIVMYFQFSCNAGFHTGLKKEIVGERKEALMNCT